MWPGRGQHWNFETLQCLGPRPEILDRYISLSCLRWLPTACHEWLAYFRWPQWVTWLVTWWGTVSLLIDGRTVTEETEIRESWAKYYENLADPGQPNPERSRMVDYMRILSRLDTTAISVTPDLIRKAITRLNNGKATDRYGVAAEQLKMLTPKALGTLATIINKIFQTRRVPDFMKMSYKLPIPKKDKDWRIQDNHKDITIAPIITKVLETVCLESGLSTDIKTNGLQFGFAIGKSPSMATLLVTEAIAEAKANRTPLYIATLDARKAFDVVNHQVLKTKLYNSPICGRLWNMIDDLYTGGNEVIRWNGKYSSPYQAKQGVKQGGILSPCLYKLYLYDLLDTLKKSDLGLHIGCTYVGTPTCADDVLHLASTGYELQSMLSFNGLYADKHMYEIHPVKSSVTIMHQPTASPPGRWQLESTLEWSAPHDRHKQAHRCGPRNRRGPDHYSNNGLYPSWTGLDERQRKTRHQ